MLIDMVVVDMVEVPVVQVVDVTSVPDGGVSAVGAMNMGMVAVFYVGGRCHDRILACCSLDTACSLATAGRGASATCGQG